MKTTSLKDATFLLASIVIASIIFFNIAGDFSKTRNLEAKENPLPQKVDPAKDLKSLDNYIAYSLPEGWKKQDQIDQAGKNTLIALTSPDFETATNSAVNSGLKVIIDRTYDPKPEESLTAKLNAKYQFYDYNIRPLTINGKNAMTMHEDYLGHNRFIYIVSANHLWQISFTSQSLEDEEKYQGTIENFLNSIQFKD